jgi:hypothetical protein
MGCATDSYQTCTGQAACPGTLVCKSVDLVLPKTVGGMAKTITLGVCVEP